MRLGEYGGVVRGWLSKWSYIVVLVVEKLSRVGRRTMSGEGIGGVCGRRSLAVDRTKSEVVEVLPEVVSRVRDRDLLRDLRCGSTLGTWRNCEVIAGITSTCMDGGG